MADGDGTAGGMGMGMIITLLLVLIVVVVAGIYFFGGHGSGPTVSVPGGTTVAGTITVPK